MISISPQKVAVYGLALVLFLFHAFADAKLIRGRGRGGVTVSFGTLDILVPETEIIPGFGMLRWDYYNSPPASNPFNSAFIPPGYPMVMPVPDDCFVELDSGQQFDDEPCYYLFRQNEPLVMTGSTVTHFPLAIQDIRWRIFDINADLFFDLPLYEFGTAFSTIEAGPFDQAEREIYFNAPMPNDIAPGEYRIQIEVTQTAPDGYVFYSADTTQIGESCIFGPGIDCALIGQVSGKTFIRSNAERLVITANEPTTIALIVMALFGLYRRRPISRTS